MNFNDVLAKIRVNRQSLASVIALLLIAFAGYLVYSYFAKSGSRGESALSVEELEQAMGEVKVSDDNSGSITTNTDENEAVTLAEDTSLNAADQNKESGEVAGTVTTAKWVATNYNRGDITGDTHAVKSGDTLWEIAEAKYGSGYEWTKIRDANLDKVGTLANGRPLITPGTVLVLPD